MTYDNFITSGDIYQSMGLDNNFVLIKQESNV